jgi:hypothetical protein
MCKALRFQIYIQYLLPGHIPGSISGKESVHDMSTEVHTESNAGERGRFDIYDIVETS